MKNLSYGAVVLGFFALSLPLTAYDNSPSSIQIIPEVIWAAATGGGTWVTELQITDFTGWSSIAINYFYSGNGSSGLHRYNNQLYIIPGQYRSVKSSNILATLYAEDDTFNYYGTVGMLVIATQDSGHVIKATARTVNGNFGKTFPGLRNVDSNFANTGRHMVIQDLRQNATYRTSVGCCNYSGGGYCYVTFYLHDENGVVIGSPFTKSFGNGQCITFNPFVQAGVPSGTYDNAWLYIVPTSVEYGTGGLMCYASTANNYTNDTYAHLATQFQ